MDGHLFIVIDEDQEEFIMKTIEDQDGYDFKDGAHILTKLSVNSKRLSKTERSLLSDAIGTNW